MRKTTESAKKKTAGKTGKRNLGEELENVRNEVEKLKKTLASVIDCMIVLNDREKSGLEKFDAENGLIDCFLDSFPDQADYSDGTELSGDVSRSSNAELS